MTLSANFGRRSVLVQIATGIGIWGSKWGDGTTLHSNKGTPLFCSTLILCGKAASDMQDIHANASSRDGRCLTHVRKRKSQCFYIGINTFFVMGFEWSFIKWAGLKGKHDYAYHSGGNCKLLLNARPDMLTCNLNETKDYLGHQICIIVCTWFRFHAHIFLL